MSTETPLLLKRVVQPGGILHFKGQRYFADYLLPHIGQAVGVRFTPPISEDSGNVWLRVLVKVADHGLCYQACMAYDVRGYTKPNGAKVENQ